MFASLAVEEALEAFWESAELWAVRRLNCAFLSGMRKQARDENPERHSASEPCWCVAGAACWSRQRGF